MPSVFKFESGCRGSDNLCRISDMQILKRASPAPIGKKRVSSRNVTDKMCRFGKPENGTPRLVIFCSSPGVILCCFWAAQAKNSDELLTANWNDNQNLEKDLVPIAWRQVNP